jgi:flagellin
MYVNTNVAALNAWQNLYNTQQSMNNTLEQLSSGYRINTAANDPAGLAISQQMQAQIGGLNQAFQNSQSGISLLQTADGALGQIQNILQSMRSLASEAATATMNPTDAQNLQVEMNQYASEITQITNTTQFNDINLLGGNFTNQNIQVGANQGQSLAISLGAADAYTLGITGQTASITTVGNVASSIAAVTGLANNSYTLAGSVTPWSATLGGTNTADFVSLQGSYAGTTADTATINVTSSQSGSAPTISVTDGGQVTNYSGTYNGTNTTYAVTLGGSSFTLTLAGTGASGDSFTLKLNPTTTTFTLTDTTSNAAATTTIDGPLSNNQSVSVTLGNGALSFDAGSAVVGDTTASYTQTGSTAPTPGTAITSTSFSVSQNGSAATAYANGTGNATATTGINITTQAGAQAALSVIDNAINQLSTERANVGAYQNRLQFAATDVQTTAQNLTAARGTIVNADMAQQMSALAQEQVLQQSGVAMLAQANAVPQALLKLLP